MRGFLDMNVLFTHTTLLIDYFRNKTLVSERNQLVVNKVLLTEVTSHNANDHIKLGEVRMVCSFLQDKYKVSEINLDSDTG